MGLRTTHVVTVLRQKEWKLFGSAIMMSLDNNQSRIQRSADSQILQLAAAFAII